MIKGYMVRGKWRDGRDVYAFWWTAIGDVQWTVDRDVEPKDGTLLFATIGDAIKAMLKSSHLADVRIHAVAEDGTETLLPSYEEALAQWREDARQMQALYEETHRALDAAVVERDALRAGRDTERMAWARLVKATAEERDAAACAIAERERGVRGGYIALEQRELMAARQALRDLGVGVDALLSD